DLDNSDRSLSDATQEPMSRWLPLPSQSKQSILSGRYISPFAICIIDPEKRSHDCVMNETKEGGGRGETAGFTYRGEVVHFDFCLEARDVTAVLAQFGESKERVASAEGFLVVEVGCS